MLGRVTLVTFYYVCSVLFLEGLQLVDACQDIVGFILVCVALLHSRLHGVLFRRHGLYQVQRGFD